MINKVFIYKLKYNIPKNIEFSYEFDNVYFILIFKIKDKVILQVTKFNNKLIVKKLVNGEYKNINILENAPINNNDELYDYIMNNLR